ncbi:MULE transposase domain [Arabidopsis thaliana x Arabidopsis arenosa]|uniref:MULE transposase domain n=1 Tax=Arabidopsis thaliana x Arabidopsis arenosa TaxID=1240361 RepID=A0A8T1XF93_9BRAS|nr:MULE transposase domain [Arabidopsis thaliana x Arabidopsis arenosa]
MTDPVPVIVVSGNWVKKHKFVFNTDDKGCRVVQIDEETTHDKLVKLVLDDYGLNELSHQLKLSYMFSKKAMKNMSLDTPPVYVSNDRQLQCFLSLRKIDQLRLCVEFTVKEYMEISRKDGSRGRMKRPSSSGSKLESRYEVPDGGFEGFCYDYSENQDEEAGDQEAGDQEADDEEEDDEFSSRFDVFDDSDGASSDDDNFTVYGDPQNKDEDSPSLPPKKKPQNIEMAGSAGDSEALRLELSSLNLAVGQRYRSKEDLVYRLKLLAVRDGFDFNVPVSNPTAVNIVCWVDECRWRVRASTQGMSHILYGQIRVQSRVFNLMMKEDSTMGSLLLVPVLLGFLSCAKLLLSTVTFLHGSYKGTLLTALAQDGNFQIYPIAFGIVDTENDDSWRWFFTQLKVVIPDDKDLAIISDRHKSIGKAIGEVFPLASRGICTYHLYKNILVKFKGKHLFPLVKKAARCFRLSDFNEAFNEIEASDQNLHGYLQRAGVQMWARVHFPGERYNLMTTNIAESMNKALSKARSLPIVRLLESIRTMMTRWFAERRVDANSQQTTLSRGVENCYRPVSPRQDLWVYKRLMLYACSPYYKRSYLVSAYAAPIMPSDTAIPVPQIVVNQPCLPPIVVNQPGRPKKIRIKSSLEVAIGNKRPRKQHRSRLGGDSRVDEKTASEGNEELDRMEIRMRMRYGENRRRDKGVPIACDCSAAVLVATSRDPNTRGKLYFSCPVLVVAAVFMRWWTVALCDEFEKIKEEKNEMKQDLDAAKKRIEAQEEKIFLMEEKFEALEKKYQSLNKYLSLTHRLSFVFLSNPLHKIYPVHLPIDMVAVVPHIDLKFFGEVAAIIIADGREDLPVLNPGVGYWVDKTTVTWFKFNHDLSVAIAEILEHNWHHEWPTYRLIPADVKRRWFILLARKYTWDPMQTSTVWTQFHLVARTIFRDQMRKFLSDVLGIIVANGREDLPVLNPGVGYWVDKTTVTWFKFNYDLSVAIAEILKQNWHHEWPTYHLIPADVKERWFILLAVFKSKTDKNPNRRFFGCQLYKEGGNAHCKFFRWLDEEVIGWPKRALAEAQSVIKEKTEKIEELNATILELRGDLERQNLELSSINTEDEKISIELGLQKRIDEMETIVYRQRIVIRGLTGLLVCVVSAIVFCIVSDV